MNTDLYLDLPPVRCFSCQKVLADKYEIYKLMITGGNMSAEAALIEILLGERYDRYLRLLETGIPVVRIEDDKEIRYLKPLKPKEAFRELKLEDKYSKFMELVNKGSASVKDRNIFITAVISGALRDIKKKLIQKVSLQDIFKEYGIENSYQRFLYLTNRKILSPKEALDLLGLRRMCCRTNLISPAILPFRMDDDNYLEYESKPEKMIELDQVADPETISTFDRVNLVSNKPDSKISLSKVINSNPSYRQSIQPTVQNVQFKLPEINSEDFDTQDLDPQEEDLSFNPPSIPIVKIIQSNKGPTTKRTYIAR